MKKIFTLVSTALLLIHQANSQVVLNEIYGNPGGGNHEFFELYNLGVESTPASVDGITVVTYFEQGSTKGFYVLDLPSLYIQPRGFLAGASAVPFSYQSESNATTASFSWNDPNLTTNSGFLQKWVLTGSDNSDGNVSYNLASVPSNFNDLFYKKSGSGFNYAVFVFRNGLMVNSFYSGTGTSVQPALITSMPDLNLNYLVSGTANPFTINFDDLTANAAEYMVSESGTDNGFIRSKDGMCNTWMKSSASVNHSPAGTNGSTADYDGIVTIAGTITRGVSPATTSSVLFDITGGASSAFPVELQVYTDVGSIAGELDALDVYVGSKIQNTVADPAATLTFSPTNANILVVAKTAAGCFGQVKSLSGGLNQTLPVKLLSFDGYISASRVTLAWKVEENETAESFEIEKSTNGINFYEAGRVEARQLNGVQQYGYQETVSLKEKNYYRLKMTDNRQKVEYSKIILVGSQEKSLENARIARNPVAENVQISYNAGRNELLQLKIVDLNGVVRKQKTFEVYAGVNQLLLNLDNSTPAGMYILMIASPSERRSIKIVRQ